MTPLEDHQEDTMTKVDDRRASLMEKLEVETAELASARDAWGGLLVEKFDLERRTDNQLRRINYAQAQVDKIQRALSDIDKPWNNAKSGEGWVLTINGMETMAVVNEDNNFILADVELFTHTSDMDDITAGRRVFPVEEGS